LFRLPLRRPGQLEAEVDDEIRLHLELRVQALMRDGMSRTVAEREAQSRFGAGEGADVELLAAARRREARLSLLDRLDAIAHDLRFALRQIRRSPGLVVSVALAFGLGIGANATMFGIVDRLLLRAPAHVASAHELVELKVQKTGASGRTFANEVVNYPEYTDVRDNVSSFADVAMYTRARTVSLELGEAARPVSVVQVSGNYFQTLGTRTLLGRPLLPDDDKLPTGSAVAVISHGLWEQQFGSDPEVIGRSIRLAARAFTVVGVAPQDFVGVGTVPVDVWIPISAAEGMRFARGNWVTARNSWWLWVIGRVKPGIGREVAAEQSTAALRAGEQAARGRADTTTVALLNSVLPADRGPLTKENRVALLLAVVSVLVLLIACANVANLLLVRAVRRRREIAVRLALGISRSRLARQLMLEGAVMATLGGAAALVIVHWGSALVQQALLGDYAWPESAIDARVLAFTATATLLVGILAGLAPALHSRSLDLSRSLKDGSGAAGTGSSPIRAVLMAVQAGLAVVLLAGTGLFVRSVQNITSVDLGLDAERLVMGTNDLSSVGFDTLEVNAYFRALVQRVKRIPGVRAATAAEAPPLGQWSFGIHIRVPGRDSLPRQGGPFKHSVIEDYFATVGTRIVRGRAFVEGDHIPGAEPVVILNEEGANALWPGEPAVGRCVHIGPKDAPCARVVGIAENTYRNGIVDGESGTQVYLPLGRSS
ncbi:MAG: ABC transporter permease, partial [Gemmatimonadaceae bacterium]